MALPVNRPNFEIPAVATTASIATTPVAGITVAHTAGYIQRVFATATGTTTGTITVAVAVNGGSDIAGGTLTLAAGTNATNEVILPLVGTSAVYVNEGDLISFTPSGGTGSSIPGNFVAVIRALS